MNQDFKIVIKNIKPKTKETDPEKIEARKEKRRLQQEARKDKPKEPKQPKEKTNTEDIDNLNKSLKNIIGYSIDEINEKIKSLKVSPVQLGPEPAIIEEVIKEKKKRKKKE
jgi:hypothetical protein